MRECWDAFGKLESKQFRYLAAACVIALVLVVGLADNAVAQTATGTITGTITDAKGAAMAGVAVAVHNADTGVDLKPVATNNLGIYLIPLLPPGNYDVIASQIGFSTVQNKAITVQVGATVRIDITLPVASQQSFVTVTTEAPVLETEKTEQSQNISQNVVSNLPLSARRWEQFVFLTPGVNPDGAGGAVSFHGLNSLYNSNSVDGANNNSSYGGSSRGGGGDGYVYSPDSIREFQVSQSSFSAELGQAAGGSVNAITKSGTSQFHGDLFYYGRAPQFNADDPIVKVGAAKNGTAATQAVHQQNQWGGSLGGPIIKDKLFFFVTDDGYRKVSPLSTTTPQLTPSILSFTCPTVAAFSPAQQATLNTECASAKSFIFSRVLGNFARQLRQDVELVKLDYQLNQANHLNVVADLRDWKQPTDTASVNGGTSYMQDRFVIATWNTVIGSNKVNEFRYQWSRDNTFSVINHGIGFPGATLSSLFSYGLTNGTTFSAEGRNQVSDNFSLTKGTHTIKFGVDLNFILDNQRSASNSTGAFQYSNFVPFATGITCTNAAAQNPNNIFCDWLVDLVGVPDGAKTGQHWGTYSQVEDIVSAAQGAVYPKTFDYNIPDQDYAGYVQDTWKARRNLTINFGLRYDAQILPSQVLNPSSVVFGSADLPILAYYTSSIHSDLLPLQPRLGIAWNLTKNTVLRAGGGVYYAKTPGNTVRTIYSGVAEDILNCSTPVTTTGINPTCLANLKYPNILYNQQDVTSWSPFPGALTGAALSPVAMNPNPKFGIRAIDPMAKRPRAYEFEAAVERQLGAKLNLSASYVFTRGNFIPSQLDANLASNVDLNNGQVVTKTYDVVNSTGVTQLTSTVPLFFRRIDPRTGPIITQNTPVNSRYNALIVTARMPMNHGFEVLANYTLSKSTDDGQAGNNDAGGGSISSEGFVATDGVLNPFNIQAEQGLSAIDARNRFTTSVIWQPTFGKGSTGAKRLLLSGWSASGSGLATNGTRYSGTVSSTASPSVVIGGITYTGLEGCMTGACIQTTTNTIGGRISWMPRNSFVLPNLYNIDLRVAKQFTFKERYSIELRGEAFNLFNSTLVQAVSPNAYNYAQPSLTSTTCPSSLHSNTCMVPVATFQTPTTTTGFLLGPRQLQAGLRFNF